MMMSVEEAIFSWLIFFGIIFFWLGVVYPAMMAMRWLLFYKHRVSFKKYMKYI